MHKLIHIVLSTAIFAGLLVCTPSHADACGWSPYKGYKNAVSPKRRAVDRLLEKKEWAKALVLLQTIPEAAADITRKRLNTAKFKGVATVEHESLLPTIVQKKAHKKNTQITHCFLNHLRSAGAETGTIELTFEVNTKGRVTDMQSSGFSPKLGTCSAAALATLRFAKLKSPAQVRYTISFTDRAKRYPFHGYGYYHYQLATAHYHLGNLTEAQDVAELLKKNYFYRTESRWQLLLLLANLENATGDISQAIDFAKQAVQARPKDARLHASLGTFYEKAQELSRAEASLSEAVRLNPKHHGGMEWVHLEVVRFRIQLKAEPESYKDRPFLHSQRKKLSSKKLTTFIRFAQKLAPELPIH